MTVEGASRPGGMPAGFTGSLQTGSAAENLKLPVNHHDLASDSDQLGACTARALPLTLDSDCRPLAPDPGG